MSAAHQKEKSRGVPRDFLLVPGCGLSTSEWNDSAH